MLYNYSKLDLANLVNIAAIKAAVEGAENLAAAQLEFAKDRIIMGTERKTMSISEESKKVMYSIYVMKSGLALELLAVIYMIDMCGCKSLQFLTLFPSKKNLT